jgi:hypothetical protein
LPFWRSIAAKERRRVCSCHLRFSSSCLRAIFLSDQGVSRCIHGLAECSGQVKVWGLVTLGVWRLLDGLGVWRVLGELLEIVGASRQAWYTRFETHRSGDGEWVL